MAYSLVGRGVVVAIVQGAGNTLARSVAVVAVVAVVSVVSVVSVVVVAVVVAEDEDVDSDVDVVIYTYRFDSVSDPVLKVLSHSNCLSFVAYLSYPMLVFYVYLRERYPCPTLMVQKLVALQWVDL